MYEYLTSVFTKALEKTGASNFTLVFEAPKIASHGDAATNVAMTLAKQLGKAPRSIAQDILDNLEYESNLIAGVEIAGAGFINIRFTTAYYAQVLQHILAAGQSYGANTTGNGRSANVEYVSANPTGPLHPGHGRGTMLGDAIANLLQWSGYKVIREYYFNNAGNQMNNLARSVYARYRQALGEADFPFDEENGYKGEYIQHIAQALVQEYGDKLKEQNEENLTICRKKGEQWCFASIKATLARLGIHHDVFFNEHSLYTDGKIDATVATLRDKGLVYEKDGATWIKTSELGLEQDKVIIKSTGEPTYRLPDMAYHRIKCERGDDVIVDIFGADHIATAQEVVAGVKAMGFDTSKIKVILHQMVSFIKDGSPYKLSKRNGEQVTLDDLMDDVGVDVVRYFYLMRSADTQLVFDMTLAKEQSNKNPGLYLQYAHARVCSIFAKAQERGIAIAENCDLNLLVHPTEIALIKMLERFPVVVQKATVNMEPHTVADYLREMAASVHQFHHECRVLQAESEALRDARFALIKAAQHVLKNGTSILGISAPERMEREEVEENEE